MTLGDLEEALMGSPTLAEADEDGTPRPSTGGPGFATALEETQLPQERTPSRSPGGAGITTVAEEETLPHEGLEAPHVATMAEEETLPHEGLQATRAEEETLPHEGLEAPHATTVAEEETLPHEAPASAANEGPGPAASTAQSQAPPPSAEDEDLFGTAGVNSPSPMRVPPTAPTPQKQPPPAPPTGFVDESRFMRDDAGNLLHKWRVEYAQRGGGGRAMCRDLDCLERHEQSGVRSIEKGALRIGRRVLMEQGGESQVSTMWYHARCMFNTFTRSRKTTRVIESPEDLEGFDDLKPEDQELIRRIIARREDLKNVRFNLGEDADRSGPKRRMTPGEAAMEQPAPKRVKEPEPINVRAGDRVWAHFRCRQHVAEGLLAVKSPKPELCMVVEEPCDDMIIVQFESEEHEKQRLEKLDNRKFKNIKSWLRYPRLFEGQKQRLPIKWVQWKRTPPRLCSCNVQCWQHECRDKVTGEYLSGACTRGTTKKVFGICQA